MTNIKLVPLEAIQDERPAKALGAWVLNQVEAYRAFRGLPLRTCARRAYSVDSTRTFDGLLGIDSAHRLQFSGAGFGKNSRP